MAAEFTVQKPTSIYRAYLYFNMRKTRETGPSESLGRKNYLVIREVIIQFVYSCDSSELPVLCLSVSLSVNTIPEPLSLNIT